MGYNIKQINFIMGIRGTTTSGQTLGFKAARIEKINEKCMIFSIDGMQEVMFE